MFSLSFIQTLALFLFFFFEESVTLLFFPLKEIINGWHVIITVLVGRYFLGVLVGGLGSLGF